MAISWLSSPAGEKKIVLLIKMKNKKVFLLLLFAALPLPAAGAEGYSLKECLSMAAGRNPDLLRERAALDENQAGYVVSRGALLPQLDATLSYQRYDQQLPSKKVLFGASLDDYYSDITVKQLLFSGGKYVSQLRSSKVSVEAQKQRLSLTERDLAFNVTKAYYEQLRAAQTLEIQKSVLEKLSQQRVAAQLLYNGGRTSVVDVLKIQTNESAQRDAVANAENQVYVKALALGQAMGVEEPVWAAFAMPQINETAAFEKTIPAAVLDANPEMLYAARNVEKSGLEIKTALASHYPALYLKGTYFMEDKEFFPGNANSYAGVFLALPIYYGGAVSAQTDRAGARYAQARETERKARLSLYSRYAAAVSTALDKKERVATSAKTLELAKETLTASELRYSAGKISVLDLLDAQNLWSNAYMSYANVTFDYLINTAEVKAIWPEAVTGEILK